MECTVPVEVHLATDHADVGSLERTVSAALAEVGTRLWAELFGRLEAALAAPPECSLCGGPTKANGRAPRRLVTLAGEVEIRRRRYRCTLCGAERVPLDEALGLEPRTAHTLGVRERGLWLVTKDELRPLGRGRRRAAGLADRPGRAAPLRWRPRARLSKPPGPPRPRPSWARDHSGRRGAVAAARSGSAPTQTMVHDRASGTELEVKVGLVFEGARRIGRNRRSLTGRMLDAGTENWMAFAERFTALCAKLGVYEAERIIFVSDGAAAIRWIAERAFPDAIVLLDWYHLVEALRTAIGPNRPDRLETALAAAEPGDAERLLELLAGWAFEEAGTDPDRSDKLVSVAGYVAANRAAIENYRVVPLASSGPMEKAVDIVVARRFKARGMSWFRRGVSALVRLRLLRLNGTWTRYWSERFAAALRPWPSPA